MLQLVDLYLMAWGLVQRAEAAELKRVKVSQARYSAEVGGGTVVRVESDFVEVPDRDGRMQRVSWELVELTGKVLLALPDEYREWLVVHYKLPGSINDKAVRLGISPATYKRRVRDAKHAFGAVWASVRHRVVQRGVAMRVMEFDEEVLTTLS